MHGKEAWTSFNSPAGLKYYYLHASFSCVNVCNKAIPAVSWGKRGTTIPLHICQKTPGCVSAGVPLWISISPRELCPISAEQTTGDEGGRGQRLDVLQLPMGTVSPSRRPGIIDSWASWQAAAAAASSPPAPLQSPSTENYARHKKGTLSNLVLRDILTRVPCIFHSSVQVIQSGVTSRVINRKGLTLFTRS